MRATELVERRGREQRAADWRRLAELLRIDPGEDQPELVDELVEICRRLRVSTSDLERMRNMLGAFDSFRGYYDADADLRPEIHKAEARTRKSAEELSKIWAKLHEKHMKVLEAENALKVRLKRAQDSVGEMHKLKREFPELMAHLDVPPMP